MDYDTDDAAGANHAQSPARPRKRPRTIPDSPPTPPTTHPSIAHAAPAPPRRRASIDVRYNDPSDDDDDMDIEILDTPTSPRHQRKSGASASGRTSSSTSVSVSASADSLTTVGSTGSRPIRIRAILSSAPAAAAPAPVKAETEPAAAADATPTPPAPTSTRSGGGAKQKRAKDLYATLTRALDTIHRKDQYRFFSEPVDTRAVPTYLAVISHPMDFGTMREKVKAKVYKSLAQFEADFWLVIGNCKKFNEAGSIYWREADKIEVWGRNWFDKERDSEFIGVGPGDAATSSPGPSAFASTAYDEAAGGGSPGPKRSARLRSKVDTRGGLDGAFDADSFDGASSATPLSLAERAADMFEHTATKRYTTSGTLAAKHLTAPPFLFAANGSLVPPPELPSATLADLPLHPAHAALRSGHAPLITSHQHMRTGAVRTTYAPATSDDWFPFSADADGAPDDFGVVAGAIEDDKNELLNEYAETVWGGTLGEAYAGSLKQFVHGLPDVVARKARERLVKCSRGAAGVAASVMAALVVPSKLPTAKSDSHAEMDVDVDAPNGMADGWASRLCPLPGQEPDHNQASSSQYLLSTELGIVDIASECTHALAAHSLIDMNLLATDPDQGWDVAELQGMLAHSLVAEIRQQVNARDEAKVRQQLDVVGKLLAGWRPRQEGARERRDEVRLRLLGLAHQLPAGVVKPLRVSKATAAPPDKQEVSEEDSRARGESAESNGSSGGS